MDRQKLKHHMILATYAIVLFLILFNFSYFVGALDKFYSVIVPVVYGFVIAFLMNIPYKWLRRRVFHRIEEKAGPYKNAAIILSIFTAYTIVSIIMVILVRFFIPQLIASLTQLVQNIPYYLTVVEAYTNRFVEYFHLAQFVDAQVIKFWTTFNDRATSILADAIPYIGTYFVSITSGIFNWLIGVVISIYFIFSKDTLKRQLNLLLLAFAPEKRIDRILELSARTNLIFNRFIAGDLLDALIVGIVCFIGTSFMETPYALLVSVIIGITNIIPIFGPFIGAIPSLFLIVIVDPFKALLFLIFIFALQQVDGNIIKPQVFGNTLGLPSLWVLVSIVIGGGLFGIIGMILGVPAFALFYSIVREVVHERLDEKEEEIEEI